MNQDRQQIIGAQNLAKAEMPINYKYDSAGARMYFSSPVECFGRFFVLVGLLGNAFIILFFAGLLGALSTEAIPFSPLLNPIGQPLYEGITLISTVFGLLFLFAFLIITLVIKRIRSLIIYGWLFNILGTLFNAGLMGLIFLMGFNAQNLWSLLSLIISIFSLCCWWLGSCFWLCAAYGRRRLLEKSYLGLIRKDQ